METFGYVKVMLRGRASCGRLLTALAALLLLQGTSLNAQHTSLSLNMGDVARLGTANAELSLSFARHWSANAGGRYNPFSYPRPVWLPYGTQEQTSAPSDADRIQDKQLCGWAGVRYWPWHVFSGWWLGAKLQYQEFNQGGLRSRITGEGDRAGGGITAGYSYMLGRSFNIEMGAGVWGGYERYKKYECPKCGLTVDEGGKYFILPSELILALVFVF